MVSDVGTLTLVPSLISVWGKITISKNDYIITFLSNKGIPYQQTICAMNFLDVKNVYLIFITQMKPWHFLFNNSYKYKKNILK